MDTDNAHLALSREVNAAFTGLADLPHQVSSSLAAQLPAPLPSPATAGGVRWLTDQKREQTYDLQFPFELDGVEYRTIMVKRLSAGQVDAFIQSLAKDASSEDRRLPMYFVGDAEISDAAWAVLDDDDVYGVAEVAGDLLPLRFRRTPG